MKCRRSNASSIFLYTGHVDAAFQGSLLDLSQDVGLRALGPAMQRTTLAHGAWLDLLPGWVQGADALFERLIGAVPWRAERRWMYDQVVDVPRLLCCYGEGDDPPDPALAAARRALSAHYRRELGEELCTVGMCLYRDGRDSVAWHGDTSGRRTPRTVVAIVSLGAPRALLLRPRAGGGPVLRHEVGHGDLLVMGGTCQRTWQHAIPKTARAAGPRISIQVRPRGIH
jgi:alkylated DNA repair dioxygenase AlkB